MTRLVIATKNPGKLAEMREIMASLGWAVEVVEAAAWPDVDETGDTLEANALLKARAAVAASGISALADDTGLEVAALGGAPGVHSARFAGPRATAEDNVRKLLAELEGVRDRSARFVTVVALARPDGSALTARGELRGRIAEEARGSGGFGYDPVFEVRGKTLAELSVADKNRLSHRALALRRLGEMCGREDSNLHGLSSTRT